MNVLYIVGGIILLGWISFCFGCPLEAFFFDNQSTKRWIPRCLGLGLIALGVLTLGIYLYY